MVFKNEAQLKNFLLAKCKNALVKSQEQIYRIIDRFVKKFYADYDPVLYERTNQLLNSLVKSEIISTGNGFEAQVYFDLDSLNYVTGAQPSGKQVMDAAAYGGHGAEGLRVVSGDTGVSIWDDPMQILSTEAIEILREMLISEGIPIKKI